MTKKKKIFLTIILIFFIALAFLSIKAYLFFNAKPTISVNYVARWNEFTKPENYDPNKNAFFDYEKAAECVIIEPNEIRYSDFFPNWPEDMNDAELNILKDWLERNNPALEYFIIGSEKEYCWHDIPEDVNKFWDISVSYLAGMRQSVNALSWQSKLYSSQDKLEEAVNSILASYKASNQLHGPNKTLVEQLVSIALRSISIETAIEILANNNFDFITLLEFRDALQRETSKNVRKLYFGSEIYWNDDIIQRLFTDNRRGNGHLIPQEYRKMFPKTETTMIDPSGQITTVYDRPSFFVWLKDMISKLFSTSNGDNDDKSLNDAQLFWLALTGPDRKETYLTFNNLIEEADELQSQSPWQLRNKGINPEKQLSEKLKDYVIDSSGVYTRVIEMNQIANAGESALFTVVSLLIFKSEKGAYPDSLAELVSSGYIEILLQDPYNNGPLTYRKVEDNFILYSVGPNFIDDGGEISRSYDGSIKWWYNRGDTVFWPRPRETKQERESRLERTGRSP